MFAVDFDISYGLIGLVLAGEGIGTLIADVPTGVIQRRFGNKQVMMMGILVKALSVFLLFFAPTIWVFWSCASLPVSAARCIPFQRMFTSPTRSD